jgi:hypothetical protein
MAIFVSHFRNNCNPNTFSMLMRCPIAGKKGKNQKPEI